MVRYGERLQIGDKMSIYNVYCDESCHLENDRLSIMALGCVWCAKDEIKRLSSEINQIKKEYNANGELKWTKVSISREKFYLRLVDWFFEQESLNFRTLVVKNKNKLNHEYFNQGSHDNFYYKMYFSLLNKILSPTNNYNIYIDIKDTRSRFKLQKLKDVLCNNVYDFTNTMINNIQNIHSHESHLMQFVDFLLGAVTYRNRDLNSNKAKVNIIQTLENKLGYSLICSTPLKNEKFNLFMFSPR